MNRLPLTDKVVLTLHALEVNELLDLLRNTLAPLETLNRPLEPVDSPYAVATLQHVEDYILRKVQDKLEGR